MFTLLSLAGTVFGADDFLPCLTWVLLRCDLVTLQVDTDYMMELLDPAQLQGEGESNTLKLTHAHSTKLQPKHTEGSVYVTQTALLLSTGGYYLTTLYASLYYISSFQQRLAVRQLSVEAQHSINQWHRRRTLHCDQSRRSKHRRTIRRQVCQERAMENSETETGSKEECGRENNFDNIESNTKALPWEKTERDQELRDQSLTLAPASGCQSVTQQEEITRKQEAGQTLCVVAEEDQKEL